MCEQQLARHVWLELRPVRSPSQRLERLRRHGVHLPVQSQLRGLRRCGRERLRDRPPHEQPQLRPLRRHLPHGHRLRSRGVHGRPRRPLDRGAHGRRILRSRGELRLAGVEGHLGTRRVLGHGLRYRYLAWARGYADRLPDESDGTRVRSASGAPNRRRNPGDGWERWRWLHRQPGRDGRARRIRAKLTHGHRRVRLRALSLAHELIVRIEPCRQLAGGRDRQDDAQQPGAGLPQHRPRISGRTRPRHEPRPRRDNASVCGWFHPRSTLEGADSPHHHLRALRLVALDLSFTLRFHPCSRSWGRFFRFRGKGKRDAGEACNRLR